MNQQADLLQPVQAPATSSVPFVFLTGGKGGVGKSLVAANLASEFALSGKRVLLVDFDLSLGNLDVLMDVQPERTCADFLAGRATLEECLCPVDVAIPNRGGQVRRLWMLPGACGDASLARADAGRRRHLLREVFAAAHGFDLILGDGAAGVAPDQLAFCAAARRVIAVTTPDPAALTDAYGLIKALGQWQREGRPGVPTPRVLFNRVSGSEHAGQLHGHFTRVCMRFLNRRPQLAGWLPESREVRRCTAARQAVVAEHPSALFSHRLGRLARELEAELFPAQGSVERTVVRRRAEGKVA